MPKYLLTWTLHPSKTFFVFFLKLVTIKGPLPRLQAAWRQFPDAKPTNVWARSGFFLDLGSGLGSLNIALSLSGGEETVSDSVEWLAGLVPALNPGSLNLNTELCIRGVATFHRHLGSESDHCLPYDRAANIIILSSEIFLTVNIFS